MKLALVVFIVVFTPFLAYGQDDVKNLFYCNTNYNIDNLWLMNENLALGSNNKEGAIILIKNGLIIDSLFLGEIYTKDRKQWTFTHLQDIIQVDEENYLTVYLNGIIFQIQVKNDSLIHNSIDKKSKKIEMTKEVEDLYPYLFRHSIGKIDSFLIGYQRERIWKKGMSEGSSRDDAENFPEFWVPKIRNNEINEVKKINKTETQKTDDLFIDVEDWNMVPLRPATFQKFYDYHDGQVFFNVVRANKCYVYDIQKDSTWYFDFPDIEKGESCFYYHDKMAKKDYVVKKIRKEEYEVFLLSEDFQKAKLVKIIDFFPYKFFNNKIHQITLEKEKGKKYKCHSLVPIQENKEEKKLEVLKEIIIHKDTIK